MNSRDLRQDGRNFVKATGVRRAFGGNVAIAELDFEAAGGEVHALLGENGAGKSTFTNILVGALRPDAGSICVSGQELRGGVRRARRLGIAAVFQELAVLPDLTVAENIWIGREARSRVGLVARRSLRRRTEELLAKWDLEHLDAGRLVSELELGQRQQVAIARALSLEPRLLIFDEATSALASREAQWLVATAKRVAAGGAVVLFVTHRLREVREVADRLTVMRNGRSVLTAATPGVSDEELVEAMLGRSPGRLYPERGAATTGDVMLRVRGLRSDRRLKGVDFDVRAGEIVGLSGIQGQGQMELLHALVGLRPGQGTIEFGGRRRVFHSPAAALEAAPGAALLPLERQAEGLLLDKSIRENVSLSVVSRLAARGLISRSRERRLVEDAVRSVQLRYGDIDQPVWQLSGGNQQKVVLARLLSTDARLLLLADPMRGVDVGAKAEIFTIMRDLTASGYGILWYSTDIQELVNVADRVLVIADGQIAASLGGDGMTESAVLTAAVAGGQAAA